MKKQSLKKLALTGIVSGLCAVQAVEGAAALEKTKLNGAAAAEPKAKVEYDPNDGNLGYHLMTEDELLLELNDDGYKQYMALTPEGKAVAREVASQRCAGTNECKGRGACKTDKNSCAGQNSCKGESKCGISDKNLAVELAAKVMANKRADALKK